MTDLANDFISLFYPRYCPGCGNSLWKHEELICTSCDFHLPRTNFHLELDNPVSRVFWGRVPLESAAALYYFHKGNRVQHLVHELKYKGRKDIGVWIGKYYGNYLKNSPFFNTVDLIIPVPLHKKKFMQRGYNQSEQFAHGLMSSMNIPLDAYSLVRTRANQTQTRKSRFSRWENVSDLFAVHDPGKIEGKHILLVDDVITTGSTIESCVQALGILSNSKISVAAIATSLL